MGLSGIKTRYERLNQRVQQSAVSAGLEIAASACVVLFAGAYFVRYLHALATTGMYVDELATIAKGASLGPIVSMTDYFSENNHIFFNVITSLTLGANPYEPLRARLWSFIAMTATLILVVVFFTRRRRFLEGALVVYGIAASGTLLDLTLLARGYGIVFLCSTSMSLLLLSYLNTRRRTIARMAACLRVLWR